MNKLKLMVGLIVLATCASFASATDLQVGREFVCKPVNEVNTCMQGTLLADDVTMALLAGVTPAKASEVARWVVGGRRAEDLGFSKHAVRLSALAFKSDVRITQEQVLLARRAEVDRASRFLVPFGRVETLTRGAQMGNAGKAYKFSAIEDASRVRYSANGIDICSTTSSGRFCVRLPLLKSGKTLAQAWDAVPLLPAEAFAQSQPAFMSSAWRDHTFVGVEVEVENKAVMLVNGERIVPAKPLQMVMFNVGYLIGSADVIGRAQ